MLKMTFKFLNIFLFFQFANIVSSQVEAQFELESFNFIWSKVKKRQDLNSLRELLDQMKEIEKNLLQLKINGAAIDLKAYELQENRLRELLKIRGQSDVLNAAINKQIKFSPNTPLLINQEEYQKLKMQNKAEEQAKYEQIAHLFQDKKLIKLYIGAMDVGFSDEDLATLKQNFNDYETKLAEYRRQVAELVNQHQNENSIHHDIPNNKIDEQKLKNDNQQLIATMKEFEQSINNATTSLLTSKERIHNLIIQVDSSRLSAQEKESIKNQLEQFGKKLSKMQYLDKEQVNINKNQHLEDAAHKFDEEKSHRKLKEQEAKLTKYESYIFDKIASLNHQEL